MEIEHEGRYSKVLMPGDIDRFRGDWNTTSKGKVTDFNLMLKGCKGDFAYEIIQVQKTIEFEARENQLVFVYCIEGQASINEDELAQGELLVTCQTRLRAEAKNPAKIYVGFVYDI